MNLSDLPNELLGKIIKDSDNFMGMETLDNRFFFSTLKERSISANFDGTGKSIQNIFRRHSSIKNITMTEGDLQLFLYIFGNDHGFHLFLR
jgi:hypothetical protein